MHILTQNNKRYNITSETRADDEIYFNELDYSDENDVDYYFNFLMFLDEFTAPTARLRIGTYELLVPYHWCILICDKHSGIVEPISISQLAGKSFHFTTWGFNPVSGYMPTFHEVELLDVYPDQQWIVPRLRKNHFLTVPLSDKDKPDCVFLADDIDQVPESLDITKLI